MIFSTLSLPYMVSSTDSDPQNVDLGTIQRKSANFFAGVSDATNKVAGLFIIIKDNRPGA